MTLAIGSKSSGTSRGGFTLIEILLTIALIALASGVVILNFTAFADRGDTRSPQEILTNAISQARFMAAAERVTAELSYDQDSGNLIIEPGGESIPINSDFGSGGRGEIRFYLIPPAEGLSSFPDPTRSQLKTDSVAFAPDRSSSPFIAEIDTGEGNPTRLHYDPFSSIVRTDQ